jgi:murein DD-endopeptidase MepM/ murein hydrolase activator NlpD
MRIAALLALAGVVAMTDVATTQAPSRAPARPARTTPTAPLTVEVRSRAVRPGEVLDIRVHTTAPLASVAITLGDRPLHAWKQPSGDWRVLAGLDADHPTGPLVLTVLGTRPSGGPLNKVETLTVVPARFAERRLTVAPKFVEPPASERPRIAREAERLRAIYGAESELTPGVFAAPVPHRRSSPFGSRSIFNGVPRDRHGGMDFASPAGAAIRAPAAGRVVLVDDLYWTGNTVVVDHGRGMYSILAHMSRTLVEEGQAVTRGARLGLVGATGRATGPHLHWSVRLGGTRVDPAAVLQLLGAPRRR